MTASLRVLWAELRVLRTRVRPTQTSNEALQLQLRVAERARVAFGWSMGRSWAKGAQKKAVDEEGAPSTATETATPALPALPASNAPIASEVQTSAASSALSMQTSEKHAPEAADQSDSDVIVEEDQSVVDPKMVDAADADCSSLHTVLEELFHRKSRGGETVSGCPWCERRAAAQSPQSPACQASRKPLATRPKEPPSVEEMSLTSPPDEAPSSLEQLRGRCALFRQGHYRHLYTRRQDRAMTTGVPWSWLTARLASSHRPPYWCVVFHEASGAVLGSSRCAWQRLQSQQSPVAPLPSWRLEYRDDATASDGGRSCRQKLRAARSSCCGEGEMSAGKKQQKNKSRKTVTIVALSIVSSPDGPMAALRAAMLLPPLALSTARPSRQRACDFDEVSQDFIESRGSLLSDLPGPVILRGVLQDMLPSGKKDYFLQTFANESVLLTRNQPGSIRYLFSFLHDSEHYHLQQRLLQVYPIPEFLQKHSVSSRFMVLGSKTKGVLTTCRERCVALHQHFLSWLGLLAGAKRWFVFPPSAQLEDVSHHHQPMAELERRPGVASCATYDRSDWTFGLGAQQYNPNDDERLYAASVGNVSRLKKVKATNALLKQAAETHRGGSAAVKAVELLVKKAPMGDTLHTACHKGHLPVVQLLLAHRADVNLQDDLGDRPLNSAVMAGKSDVVEVLVQHRADVNWRRNKKKEPLLHSAARFGHVPVIRALLQSNAVLRQRLKGAGEAIHDAAHFGHRAALRELVAQRADPFASTARGSTTPLQLAMEAGHQPDVHPPRPAAAALATMDGRVEVVPSTRALCSTWRPCGAGVGSEPGVQAMSKLIFTCNLRLHGGTTTVARMDWTPSYFGARKAHVLHELFHEEAEMTWRLASRLFREEGDYDADAAQLRLRGLHGVERRQLTTEQAWLQTE
eukprot:g18743.t1